MPKNTKTHEAVQKGERRQRIHANQDNVGNDKNPSEYKSFDGEKL